MLLITEKTLVNNLFKVTFKTTLNQSELDLVAKFGDPVVEVGGSFTGPPAFTLPNTQRPLNSGFPYSQQFDGSADTEAKDKANVWATEVRARIVTVKNALVGNTDDFSGDNTETI